MKSVDANKIEAHAFVCTNARTDGRAACNAVGGQAFFEKLKERLKADGVYATRKVTRSGCLSQCNPVGCTIALYRKGETPKWFSEVKPEDFDTILKAIVEP